MKIGVEILLIRRDGAVVLQAPDNRPDATNPGFVSSFGGHIEEGEEPIEAAVREINEQTNLHLREEQLQFYRKYQNSETGDVYYFVVKDIRPEALTTYMGTGYTVIVSKEALERSHTTVLLKQVLTDYFDGFRSFIFLPDMDEITKQELLN